MLRTFQFRLYPNATQAAQLERILADNCETYNAALEERIGAWKIARKSITYRNQQDELTALRADGSYNWLACDIMRDPLRRVDRAFKAFFRRVKAKQKAGFPRWRSRYRYDSFSFGASAVREKSIRIPNVGDIRIRGGRPISGIAKIVSIKRSGKRWTASIVCDIGEAPPKRTVSKAVGIDVGLTTLVTLSDGTQIENPRWTRVYKSQSYHVIRSCGVRECGGKDAMNSCPHCGGCDARKHGVSANGFPRRQCRACMRTFTIGGPGRGANQLSQDQKDLFIRLIFDGQVSSISGAAREAGISTATGRKLYWEKRAERRMAVTI